MRVILIVVTVCVIVHYTDALNCRRCVGASSLDDCTVSVTCYHDEMCYMDQVVTGSYTIEYNAGCRARDVCIKNPVTIGKRNYATGLVSCSRCCDAMTNPECNIKLCGIQETSTVDNQCYSCENGVSKASQCTHLTTCQSNEVCGAETYREAGSTVYTFTCLNKKLCTLLTQLALQDLKRCHNGAYCPNVSKRQVAGTKVCTACCGDALCNAGECKDIIDRLYLLWENNLLDFDTLKRKTNTTSPANGK